MKRLIAPLIIVVLFTAVACCFQIGCGIFRPVINQEIEAEGTGNFAVKTYVWNGRIVYAHYTWQSLGTFEGIPASKVDSARRADYSAAEKWIVEYNRVR